MPRIPVNGQSYEAWSIDVNYQRTVNWYPEVDPTGSNNVVLYPTPGLELFGTAGAGAIRKTMEFNNSLYVVSGSQFYEVDTVGNATLIGALSTSSGIVDMAHNGTQIIIVDGSKGYLYVPGTATWTPDISAVDADFPTGADQVIFLDSYFIVNDPLITNADGSPGGFFISGNYDGLSWASLDYSIAERKPDDVKSLAVANGQLWLIGEVTSEVWYNSGNSTFPFERVNSAIIEWGTPAAQSVVEAENSIIFISKNEYGQGQVVQTRGYQVGRISDFALEKAMADYTTLEDAIAYVMQYHGHTWYVLTFPTANKTWVYDMAAGIWFEWSTNGDSSRHISNSYTYFQNKHIVGSRNTGKLYVLKDTVYDDDGVAITRLRQPPYIHQQGIALFGSALSLRFEQGVANASFPNPQVMLQWSDDGGHTWSNESWRPILGQTGVYDLPASWRRLGRWYNRVFRIKVTDGVKAVLIDGFISVDAGEDEVRK